jgi:hypothetical protein
LGMTLNMGKTKLLNNKDFKDIISQHQAFRQPRKLCLFGSLGNNYRACLATALPSILPAWLHMG